MQLTPRHGAESSEPEVIEGDRPDSLVGKGAFNLEYLMENRSIVRLFWLAALGAFLGTGSLTHADSPLFRDAQDDLHQAMNPGGDAPSVADKTKLVKEALDALKKIPMGGYHGHLKLALTACESALDVLHTGDPDNKANVYIKQAWEEVRTASD